MTGYSEEEKKVDKNKRARRLVYRHRHPEVADLVCCPDWNLWNGLQNSRCRWRLSHRNHDTAAAVTPLRTAWAGQDTKLCSPTLLSARGDGGSSSGGRQRQVGTSLRTREFRVGKREWKSLEGAARKRHHLHVSVLREAEHERKTGILGFLW